MKEKKLYRFSNTGLVLLTSFLGISVSCNRATKTDVIDSIAGVEREHYQTWVPDTVAFRKSSTCVEIKTNYGTLQLALYNATPHHRDNFLKLIRSGFYDNLLFHRIQKDFMIQAGDPLSRNAPKEMQLGSGGPGYTLDREFIDTFYHFRGALAAARQADEVNPEMQSSGSQFYIVSGRKCGRKDIHESIKNRVLSEFLKDPDNLSYMLRLQTYQNRNDMAALNVLLEEIDGLTKSKIDSLDRTYPDFARRAYATWGGSPELDHSYTIFGFLIRGFDVLDKIENATADRSQRPVENIRILSTRVLP